MIENLPELQHRCQQMVGATLGELAAHLQLPIPEHTLQAKGWIGQLIELYLGASGGSQAVHDFPLLNLELKTIPITHDKKPLESTYVCTVQSNEHAIDWRDSWVYRKLQHVLWIPVLTKSTARIPLAARVIQEPIWWRMDAATESILRADWEELMEMVALGMTRNISAKFGEYLHIRPKAANSKVLVDYLDQDAEPTKVVPRGFYLRPQFTQQILGS